MGNALAGVVQFIGASSLRPKGFDSQSGYTPRLLVQYPIRASTTPPHTLMFLSHITLMCVCVCVCV